MKMTEQINFKINNSIVWLNSKDSNWLEKINIDTLDMTKNCILDQVFGNYEETIETFPELRDKKQSKLYLFAGYTKKWKNKIIELRNSK